MSVSDWLAILPLAIFVAVLVLAWCVGLRQWRRRNEAIRAMCAKYALWKSDDWGTAPDPGIRGLFFTASYPWYLEGVVQGMRVVAFDYRIGIGRGRRYGSGVGVQRLVLDARRMFPGMFVTQQERWTFVYREPFLPIMLRRLSAEEIEGMWLRLLMASAQQPEIAEPLREPVPGGVHIRPRRMGLGR